MLFISASQHFYCVVWWTSPLASSLTLLNLVWWFMRTGIFSLFFFTVDELMFQLTEKIVDMREAVLVWACCYRYMWNEEIQSRKSSFDTHLENSMSFRCQKLYTQQFITGVGEKMYSLIYCYSLFTIFKRDFKSLNNFFFFIFYLNFIMTTYIITIKTSESGTYTWRKWKTNQTENNKKYGTYWIVIVKNCNTYYISTQVSW